MATASIPNRGEVWLVNFDPSTGAEIRKTRPAVVVNVNSIGRLPLRLVAPITDWKSRYSAYPWMVLIRANQINGLSKDSGADAFQVKSVALNRFVIRLGEVDPAEIDDVAEAIALCVGAP